MSLKERLTYYRYLSHKASTQITNKLQLYNNSIQITDSIPMILYVKEGMRGEQ